MNRATTTERVDEDVTLLRAPKPPPDYQPQSFTRSHVHFQPSTHDLAEAARRGTAVRVSVWDERRTSVAQAAALRGMRILVLRVIARSVREIGAAQQLPLDVVYDPLPAPDNERPGAAGHAGIEGLHRPPGGARERYVLVRQAIADACDPNVELVDPP